MAVITKYIKLSTQGNTDIIDITDQVEDLLNDSFVDNGIISINVIGSTAALTTCEFEPGLIKDLKEFFEKIAPQGKYHHDVTWNDGNGHSHLRSSIVGTSITVPFTEKSLVLGTWQQIIFIDFDVKPRTREIVVQIVGE